MTATTQNIFAPWNDSKAEPLLKISNITKYFGANCALDNINLSIYAKEFFALLGPSGCGKSTLLRMLAGLEEVTQGDIYLNNQKIDDIPVYKRPINMMFQSYALFPHMSVEANIAFGLKQDKVPKQEIKQRTLEVIEMVQLQPFAHRKPHQLSGGQQQRVALARSLVKRPQLLLLDEPLGALDKKLREETQFELMDLQEKLAMTFVIVTHDQEEAMTVASRIAVLNQGKVEQIDTPIEMYEYPKSRFVANFIGDINIFDSTVKQRKDGKIHLTTKENNNISLLDSNKHYGNIQVEDKVTYAVRPEKIAVHKHTDNLDTNPFENSIQGKIIDIGYLGNMTVYRIQIANQDKLLTASVSNNVRQQFMELTWEDKVVVSWNDASGLLFANS